MASTATAADAEVSTPARPGAAKDRECLYCHEFFTSSSLGRHLDQFIKEDKPKQPDGIHNVDEIQRLRGGVTRRQARNSSARHDPHRHDSTPHEPTPPAKRPRLNGPDGNFIALNRPNWLTTGVITDMSPTVASNLPSVVDTSKVNFEEEQRQFMTERNEGRAAKLALTEVIDSIKASLASPTNSSPFSFDFLAQPFPSLVLHLLPSQPTLKSQQIVQSPSCWPIEAPDESHMRLVREIVARKLDTFRQELHTRRSRRFSDESANRSPSASPEPSTTDHNLEAYSLHLEAAYEAYSSLATAEKTKLWHLSALRAFMQEQESHKDTRKRLEKTEQLLAHEAAQVKRLSSIQQPREFLLHPPTAMPLPPKAAESIVARLVGNSANEPSAASLNVDALIAKWKPGVQHNRGFQRAFLSIFEAAATAVAAAEASRHNGAALHATNGNSDGGDQGERASRHEYEHQTPNGHVHIYPEPIGAGSEAAPMPTGNARLGAHDGDSVDASGEEDDEVALPTAGVATRTARPAAGDQDVLDPSLRSGKGKDDGDFGAEDLMAKVGSLVGVDTPSGSVRKRAKR